MSAASPLGWPRYHAFTGSLTGIEPGRVLEPGALLSDLVDLAEVL